VCAELHLTPAGIVPHVSPKPLTSNPALAKVVYRNHWRDIFDGQTPPDWQPTMSVSVVIASYNSKTVGLTLASLAAQDYPEDLLEVIVVDDGSQPPVTIEGPAPKNLRLIRVKEGEGWGRSNAMDTAIRASSGDIIYWVDSDMVLFRDNVRQHAKWAHFIPEAATIGDKGFLETWDLTPQQVYEDVSSDKIRSLADPATLHRHWSLDVYDRTDDLNDSDGRNYSTHMGATASVTRLVYERTNGQDTRLHLGEDTEIAYQLWQAGAVFIPVHEGYAWHLGRATVQDKGEAVARINNVYFAQRMPIPRYRRSATRRIWEVPLLTVVVRIDDETAKFARACVDRVLNSLEADLKVILVGPWSRLHDGRRRVLADPDSEYYLIHEWFRSDARVEFVETAPDRVFPSPFRIDLPVTAGVNPEGLRSIYRRIDGKHLGRVHFFTPGHATDQAVTVTHAPAYERALRYAPAGSATDGPGDMDEVIDAVWGLEWAGLPEEQLYDLRAVDLAGPVDGSDPAVVALKEELDELRTALKLAKRMGGGRLVRGAERVSKLVGRGKRKVRRIVRERTGA